MTTRAAVVAAAEALLGVRGRTPECDAIFEDAAPCYSERSSSGKAWCGIFALHCLRTVGLTDATWKDGVGFLGSVLGWGAITDEPEPGDIAYFDKPYQHHAIVERVEGSNVHTIDGNGGNTPGIVKRMRRALANPKAAYFSIQKLVDAHTTDPAPPPYLPVRTLCKGMKGEDVKSWQELLQREMQGALPRYGADGSFGNETESWTVALQMRMAGDALPVMWGVVDEATRRLLK